MKRKKKQELRKQARAAKEVQRRQIKAEKKAANQQAKEQRHRLAREEKKSGVGSLPNKKRRHHYVWQHYLRSFTVDGKLWCQIGDKGFPASTESIAYARDFYRLKELTELDIRVIEGLIGRATAPRLAKLNRGWLPMFRKLFEIQRAYIASGQENPLLEAALDVHMNNFEEELHCMIENEAIPILSALLDGKSSVFEDRDQFGILARFIAFQYMRTQRQMKAGIASMSGEVPGFNAAAAWGLLRTIFATNIGAGMVARRSQVRATYLESAADSEFITGDQPIVNTFASIDEDTPPAEQEFFYPLSPKKALLLGFDAEAMTVSQRHLSGEETLAFNKLIARASDRQLYGAREKSVVDVVRSGTDHSKA